MRARDRDLPPGAGADHGVRHGIVGIGDGLSVKPSMLSDAVAAATHEHGEKAGRMLARFAELAEGSFIWTRTSDGCYRLGRIAGPWRYDDSAAARGVGIHHVRPAQWLRRGYSEAEVPAAVAGAFARGGRNLQRTHDGEAERRTVELWDAAKPPKT
jgi:hypothetical protein